MTEQSTPELILHVGAGKTSSTAIQRHMYLIRDELAKHGIHYADTHAPETSRPHRDLGDYAHHLHSHKWGGWLDVKTFPLTPDEAWRRLGEQIRAKGGRHILSSERFSGVLPIPAGAVMMQYIKQIAGSAQIKVVLYVRRQDALIESHFKQVLKRKTLTVDDYLANLPRMLFFGKAVTTAANAIGKENVIVRVYDKKSLFEGDSVSDFLKTCNIPVRVTEQSALTNLSLNTLVCKVLSDPKIVTVMEKHPGKAAALREFFLKKKFSDSDKYVIFDAKRRAEIMKRFERENKVLSGFMSKEDAEIFFSAGGKEVNALPKDYPAMDYESLVDLIDIVAQGGQKHLARAERP